MRRYVPGALLAVVLVMVLSVVALGADGLPWEDLEIAIGGVVLLWGAVVAAVIELGKAIRIGGNPLLDTPGKIWGANLVLGGIGVFVFELTRGADLLPALLAAGAAVLTASGVFEATKTALGKSQSSSASPSGPGITR